MRYRDPLLENIDYIKLTTYPTFLGAVCQRWRQICMDNSRALDNATYCFGFPKMHPHPDCLIFTLRDWSNLVGFS